MDERKNRIVAINVLMVIAGMCMLVYASPTLYRTFCQITGFGGTTQVAAELPSVILDREVNIQFDTNLDPRLDFEFDAAQLKQTVKVGENGLVFFRVKNNGPDVMAIASYNVTPLKTGKYYNKIQCFCFEEQLIKAGQEIEYPVSYFVDPRFDEDEYMDDVKTITLSYTFYQVDE